MKRFTPAFFAFAATLLALPLGSAQADDCECTPVVATLESCASLLPARADGPPEQSHLALACHAADGGRCEPAAPVPQSSTVHATGTPYFLPPSLPGLPPSRVEAIVFSVASSDGAEGVWRTFERPPRI